ncbi:hypothetical protein LDL36_17125 [Komagataeibacter sp. FNDCR1]|nr:hypothetical protein [Komagataeibacter sp. FNDCR1]
MIHDTDQEHDQDNREGDNQSNKAPEPFEAFLIAMTQEELQKDGRRTGSADIRHIRGDMKHATDGADDTGATQKHQEGHLACEPELFCAGIQGDGELEGEFHRETSH